MTQLSANQASAGAKHLDQIGVAGSAFAALCCLGTPALVSFITAIGLGFLINDAVLIPLLVVFLLVTLAGLYLGLRNHRQPWALALGAASAVVVLASIFAGSGILAGIGIAGLVAASLLNVWLRMRQLRSVQAR